jgi:hypothetical protein
VDVDPVLSVSVGCVWFIKFSFKKKKEV